MNATIETLPIPCRVCARPSAFAFEAPLLDMMVRYHDCAHCGYLQTQTPTWLDRAYARAINVVDTGILPRNRLNTARVLMTLVSLGRLRGRVLDHAGGYGLLVRQLRDVGVDAAWQDRYCENLVAAGFEADTGRYDLVTAFEVAEHLVQPVDELRAMFDRADHVMWSTELVPATVGHASRDWWYLGPGHGQHIGFFRPQTLAHIAGALGVHHASDGARVHLFSRRPVPATWRTALRLRALAPVVARLALRSRTMPDFDLLNQRDQRKR